MTDHHTCLPCILYAYANRYVRLITLPWSATRHHYWCKARPRLRAVVMVVMLCGYRMRELYLVSTTLPAEQEQQLEQEQQAEQKQEQEQEQGVYAEGGSTGLSTRTMDDAKDSGSIAVGGGSSANSSSDDGIVCGHPLALPLPIELWVGVVLKFTSWGDWPNEQ